MTSQASVKEATLLIYQRIKPLSVEFRRESKDGEGSGYSHIGQRAGVSDLDCELSLVPFKAYCFPPSQRSSMIDSIDGLQNLKKQVLHAKPNNLGGPASLLILRRTYY